MASVKRKQWAADSMEEACSAVKTGEWAFGKLIESTTSLLRL